MKSYREPNRPESSAENSLRRLTPIEDATPTVDPLAPRAFRSVLLGWTDPVTGDRLSVQMDGSRSLVSQLQQQGFEVMASDENESLPAAQGGLCESTETDSARHLRSETADSSNTTSFTARLLSVTHRLGRRNTA